MNKDHSSTVVAGVEVAGVGVAGIDVSKAHLDVAVHAGAGHEAAELAVANTAEGHAALVAWFRQHGVGRVGLEATGGYEQAVALALERAGFALVRHQPLEVRLFARLKRMKAKTDRIDARLIAAATAQVDAVKAAADPRLAELAQRLTAYEQAAGLVVQLRTHLEHISLPDLAALVRAQLASLKAHKQTLARDLRTRIRQQPDLARRFDLLMSLPGVGPITAISLIVRMPELGAMERGQPAALVGVAPFARDSGRSAGQRFITGGRTRPRRMLYLAALAAKRCDKDFADFVRRLTTAGKPTKIAIVAVMRKLVEAANLVLKRDKPWTKNPQPITP